MEIQDGCLGVSGSVLIRDTQLQGVAGDRIAIAGTNGSGKSSLVKAIFTVRRVGEFPRL